MEKINVSLLFFILITISAHLYGMLPIDHTYILKRLAVAKPLFSELIFEPLSLANCLDQDNPRILVGPGLTNHKICKYEMQLEVDEATREFCKKHGIDENALNRRLARESKKYLTFNKEQQDVITSGSILGENTINSETIKNITGQCARKMHFFYPINLSIIVWHGLSYTRHASASQKNGLNSIRYYPIDCHDHRKTFVMKHEISHLQNLHDLCRRLLREYSNEQHAINISQEKQADIDALLNDTDYISAFISYYKQAIVDEHLFTITKDQFIPPPAQTELARIMTIKRCNIEMDGITGVQPGYQIDWNIDELCRQRFGKTFIKSLQSFKIPYEPHDATGHASAMEQILYAEELQKKLNTKKINGQTEASSSSDL